MTKAELIKTVAEKVDTTQVEARKFVEMMFDVISDTLTNGEDVTIAGFGAFKVKERAARNARNPQTGETIEVPASHAITFKPTKTLKDAAKEL